MTREIDRPSTKHRVSEDLINETLSKNSPIDQADTSAEDQLEQIRQHNTSETRFRENRLRDAQTDRYIQDTELRKTYADKVFKFMAGYTIAMFFIVFLSGWKFPTFHIETVPLTTLIGSSFASTTGLVYLVIKGLFPVQDRPSEKAGKSPATNPDTKKGAEVP